MKRCLLRVHLGLVAFAWMGGQGFAIASAPTVALAPASAPVGGLPEPLRAPTSAQISQFKLPNGLTVIVQPGPKTGAALQMVWIRAGSIDEVDGATGLAHVMEHMLFKGSATVPAGEFSKRVARMGGTENAFTTGEYTGYFQHVPKASLGQVMQLEADRFINSQFIDAEFIKEIEVVKEERRLRTDDSPRARLWEQLMATALQASPYRRPVIGWMSDLDAMTANDARQFYQQWYRPSNAVLVVVGDVDVKQVTQWATSYFGAWKDAPLPVRKPRTEPLQEGMRRVVLKAAADQPYIALAFKVPAIRSEADLSTEHEAFALALLAGVLSGHGGARLTLALEQGPQAVAQSVAAFSGLLSRGGPNFFHLQAALVPGKKMADLEAGLREQVTKIGKEGIPEDELKRVKTLWIANDVFQRDSLRYQGHQLGRLWALGMGHDADDKVLAGIKRVTAAQVQAVASKYFGDEQLTVAELVPVARGVASQSAAQTAKAVQP
jgi:zinc protease